MYILGWFDSQITGTLNPINVDLYAMRKDQVETLIIQIPSEKEKFQFRIKTKVFALTEKSQIDLMIKNNHREIVFLLNETFINRKNIPSEMQYLLVAYEEFISCLSELLSYIEVRFSCYLSLEQPVPLSYLIVSKNELRKQLDKIIGKLNRRTEDKDIMNIVLKRIKRFINCDNHHFKVTFRDVLYKKELIKGLQELDQTFQNVSEYSKLEMLLNYLNFNSKAYIDCFTQKIADEINSYETVLEKTAQLQLYQKLFNQMHRKPGFKLNPKYHCLDFAINNWFSQETLYLEKRLHLSVIPIKGIIEKKHKSSNSDQVKQKILCILSTDQIALFLRAADELRVLNAKSMSEVFRSIVPHLSTPYKEDLSYDAMRSKSYVAEERDKEITIETLKTIIKKIKEY